MMERCLQHAFRKLTDDKSLTIGYFGGSITEAGGKSEIPGEGWGWRARTTRWFIDHYPDCAIGEVNAAIGGTGSSLGCYRCGADLLSGCPDLIFIEFALNDYRAHEDTILRSVEGIVRQIGRAGNNADIVFVYTINKNISEQMDAGVPYRSRDTHQRVADYYGIASIDVGNVLWQYIREGQATWDELMPDGTHPQEKGHGIYADEVGRVLPGLLGPGTLPDLSKPPLSPRPCEEGRLVDAWDLAGGSWQRDKTSLANRYPHMLVCGVPGSELIYPFHGRAAGLYWLIAPDSGDIEWSVDGGAVKRLSSWDHYALRFSRAAGLILADDLDEGDHILRIRILDDHDPQSKGTWIRIGAFLTE